MREPVMNPLPLKRYLRLVIACLILHLAAGATVARACLWDKDTLVDEQRGLPQMQAIIFGRYERHTREYYLRRISLTRIALKKATTAEDTKLLMDDMAVANDRLGRDPFAIHMMQDKIARFGIDYRTAANLGTFYAHAGDLKNAEIWIARALKINPQAHFGREWVQLRLIRWLQRPVKDRTPSLYGSQDPFWNATVEGLAGPISPLAIEESTDKIKSAMKASGIPDNALEATAALIKMGDREVPELYMALGQILAAQGHTALAVQAFWRAADLAGPTNPYYRYYRDAGSYLLLHIKGTAGLGWWEALQAKRMGDSVDIKFPVPLKNRAQADVLKDYIAQRDYAVKWRDAYRDYEISLIKAGKDPENLANFAAFYAQWGTPQQLYIPPADHDSSLIWPLGCAAIAAVAVIVWKK